MRHPHPPLQLPHRSQRTAPHGAFPCRDEGEIGDRWVVLAVWSDDEWTRLAGLMGVDDASLASAEARLARVDHVEELVAAWTRERTRLEVAETLQAAGIEAVPVHDFGDLHDDPQLAFRDHFTTLPHDTLGDSLYERNGFRLSDADSGYPHATPTLGQHTEHVLEALLGISTAEREQLEQSGALD